MVSWWVPYLPKGCRLDFNNGLGGDSNSGPVLAPGVYLSPTRIMAPSPSHSNLVSDEVCICSSLLALHPSFLSVFMDMCDQYSLKWRYEFNHTKCGVVTFGESKALHFQSMNEREWKLGDDTVDEVNEYKNLGVLKNYIGSFSSNVTDNIEKTRKKAGMIFSSKFDRRKRNPLVYVKFWKQACLPSLLFGSELFTLTPKFVTKT